MPKISINENNCLELTEVYLPLVLKTNDGETLVITMRDSGFELVYEGQKYEAKNGIIEQIIRNKEQKAIDKEQIKDNLEQKTGNLIQPQKTLSDIIDDFEYRKFEVLDLHENWIFRVQKDHSLVNNYILSFPDIPENTLTKFGLMIKIKGRLKNGCSLQLVNDF